ncbi:MAG: GTPase ObgE [Liquorilactobacillus ghanensis]|uniref:GTPase ObgE n=1 Tax=Liquorilactobacillus ghanensis TaxID=399370 RepID=UPI0039E7FB11
MFVDQVRINVKSGKGGDGMVAFRREKYVPKGGPAGGDGGRGGNVILQATNDQRTLLDFRYHRHFKATSGGKGMIKGMYGRGAKDLIIKVPRGTTVSDAETQQVLGDLTEDGQQLIVAKGGRGGRGNIHFASPKNPAPEIAENGEPGIEKVLQLELKVLADVGLVGFPSVGKSTLLAAVTSAKPKIAAYHFTTLAPNLGMVRLNDGRDFVMADMPGLIEGAAQGVGLGIKFLRHIERTRVLLHLIDMSSTDGRDPFTDYQKLNQELQAYDELLLKRPQIIVATKMDLPDSAENLAAFRQKLQKSTSESPQIIEISAVTHQGLTTLLHQALDLLATAPIYPTLAERKRQQQAEQGAGAEETESLFTITRDDDAVWILSGEKIEKMFDMTNLEHDESLARLARQLRHLGVDDALRERGAKDGDLVRLKDFTFEFVD